MAGITLCVKRNQKQSSRTNLKTEIRKVEFFTVAEAMQNNTYSDLVVVVVLVDFPSLARTLGECSTIHSLPGLFFFNGD